MPLITSSSVIPGAPFQFSDTINYTKDHQQSCIPQQQIKEKKKRNRDGRTMFALQNTVIPGALIIRSSFINNTSEVSRKKKTPLYPQNTLQTN